MKMKMKPVSVVAVYTIELFHRFFPENIKKFDAY